MGATVEYLAAGLCGKVGVNETSQPSRLSLIFAAVVMASFGAFALLQVFGFLPADWLSPNPKTPAIVFVLVGCFLLLGAGLVVGRLFSLPTRQINLMGWSALGIGWALSHWLVFFADDARCNFAIDAFSFGGIALCQSLAVLVLFGFDAVFLGIAVQWVLRR
jgi:hypothetical protein